MSTSPSIFKTTDDAKVILPIVAIEAFLKETIYCDYTHPHIQNEIKKHADKSKNERELAVSLFYFVRDHVRYRVGNMNRKASGTYLEKGGACTDKANLLIALCRAVGIPAGYGVMEVFGPKFFGVITPPSLAAKISKTTKHVYAHIYLSNRWIKCDPSDDLPLSISTRHLNQQSRTVEWGGVSDAVLNLNPIHILNDKGPLHNIDHIISKKQRKALYIPVRIANLYIQFLRQHGSQIKSVEALEPAFLRWLRKMHRTWYVLYVVFLKERSHQGKALAEVDDVEI